MKISIFNDDTAISTKLSLFFVMISESQFWHYLFPEKSFPCNFSQHGSQSARHILRISVGHSYKFKSIIFAPSRPWHPGDIEGTFKCEKSICNFTHECINRSQLLAPVHARLSNDLIGQKQNPPNCAVHVLLVVISGLLCLEYVRIFVLLAVLRYCKIWLLFLHISVVDAHPFMTQNSSMYMKRVRGRRYDYSDDIRRIEVYFWTLLTLPNDTHCRESTTDTEKHSETYTHSTNDRQIST